MTRLSCCQSQGYGNIIRRDFPTKSFTSSVINKNLKKPSGQQLTCELAAAQTKKEADAGNCQSDNQSQNTVTEKTRKNKAY